MSPRYTFIELDGNPPIDYLRGMLISARTSTLTALEGVEQEELDWIHAPGWNSINALTAHIAALKHLYRVMSTENRPPTPEESAAWMPAIQLGENVPALNGATLEKRIEEMRDACDQLIGSLPSLSHEDLTRKREGIFGPQGYNLAWALFHLVEDETHHRGQITIIRKLYAQTTAAT